MVACGLIAVLLDALPPQMLVPITPAWLGWCDERTPSLTPGDDVVVTTKATATSPSPNNATSAFGTMQGFSEDVAASFSEDLSSSFDDMNSSSQFMPSYNISDDDEGIDNLTTPGSVLVSNKSCTKADFNPDISFVYLAAGPIEVLSSPLVAILCDRYGSSGLLLFGLVSTAFLDIPFAYGSGFIAYLLVRVAINIVTTVTEVSYLHMIGQLFAGDDTKRARFLGLYSTVLGFDYFGPTYSGILYQISGQAVPFLSLMVIGLVTAVVFFMLGLNFNIRKSATNGTIQDPDLVEEKTTDISYLTLIKDPYILVVFIVVFLTILPKAMMAPFISIWLIDAFDATPWEIGVVYFPGFLAYIVSTIFGERILSKFPEKAWLFATICLAIDGITVIAMPFTPNIVAFSAIFTFQIATATITSFTLFPMFLKIADVRYNCPKSSSIHGFSFMAVGLAYFLGPMLASELFKHVGFRVLNIGVGSFHLLMAPFVTILRNVCNPVREINEETYLVSSQDPAATTELQSYDRPNSNNP